MVGTSHILIPSKAHPPIGLAVTARRFGIIMTIEYSINSVLRLSHS